MCCQRIAANVQKQFGIQAKRAFWTLARADTSVLFQAAAVKMRVLHADAVDYLEEIPLEQWARFEFPLPRWGHDTSNIAESLNSAISELRSLLPIQMIRALWTYIMESKYKRAHRHQ